MSASRLQRISQILQVPVPFFFEGGPTVQGKRGTSAPSPAYVSDFLATTDGLALSKASMQIKDATVRHKIALLVKDIVGNG